jgi:hypothetical protein
MALGAPATGWLVGDGLGSNLGGLIIESQRSDIAMARAHSTSSYADRIT